MSLVDYIKTRLLHSSRLLSSDVNVVTSADSRQGKIVVAYHWVLLLQLTTTDQKHLMISQQTTSFVACNAAGVNKSGLRKCHPCWY